MAEKELPLGPRRTAVNISFLSDTCRAHGVRLDKSHVIQHVQHEHVARLVHGTQQHSELHDAKASTAATHQSQRRSKLKRVLAHPIPREELPCFALVIPLLQRVQARKSIAGSDERHGDFAGQPASVTCKVARGRHKHDHHSAMALVAVAVRTVHYRL
jgi:hypothetical protein